MRSLLDRIYIDARRDESRRLAESVQRALIQGLRKTEPEINDRGVKTAPFVVLVATDMPAILAEVSCLSNADEAERLTRTIIARRSPRRWWPAFRILPDRVRAAREPKGQEPVAAEKQQSGSVAEGRRTTR